MPLSFQLNNPLATQSCRSPTDSSASVPYVLPKSGLAGGLVLLELFLFAIIMFLFFHYAALFPALDIQRTVPLELMRGRLQNHPGVLIVDGVHTRRFVCAHTVSP